MAIMKDQASTTRDHFEYWFFEMDDALERFLARLPPKTRQKLDFSPSSLDILEAWILDAYPDIATMLKHDQADIVGGAARYIGETFRRTIGGYWDIRLDDPKMAFSGLPILTGSKERPTPVCPITLVTASADRRTGNYIRTVLEAKMNDLNVT
jgi:hypothetical protein